MAADGTRQSPEVFDFYRYHPSQVAAVIFAVSFFLTTIIHTHQAAGSRTLYFIPLVIGGVCRQLFSSTLVPMDPEILLMEPYN
jgi:hypothetical protein